MENMLDNLSTLIRILSAPEESSNSDIPEQKTILSITEPILPSPETLLGQFACRPVYVLTDASEEQMTSAYWLSAPSDEAASDVDHVSRFK